MTKEEAITYLEDAKSSLPYMFEQPLNMAIDALKSKPKSKKWIKKVFGDGWNDWYVYICPYCGQVHEKITYSYAYCPNCGAYLKEDTNK